MTPEQHYKAAERLIYEAGTYNYGTEIRMDCLAEAQVHATLALYPPAIELYPSNAKTMKLEGR